MSGYECKCLYILGISFITMNTRKKRRNIDNSNLLKDLRFKGITIVGNVLSFVTHLEHQQFLPCPNVIRDALSYARCSQDVFLTFLRFDRQCRINPDQVVIALIHVQMVVQHLL